MTVRVFFFGHYRDVVPGGELSLALPARSTVADVAQLLACQDPRLVDLLKRTRTAVGAVFASAETALKDGDELAFLPPMSGG